ncbi:glial cell line-derived neurotrophic factor isoform X1 [Pteropus medius]|uniref:glial cell line-derived neurotrophic factor isoform X1 n=1 Tax=Pteropus vampyrus TaxID=132908 RepID=UPI00196A7565|nr:glial cell line-derived neurotrophic factor isoform X1 [Pteropus giganteus]
MKLWDVVAVCLVLFHTASAFPLPAGKRPPEAPAEDRSLGRRRAPFALSSDCKNRSLPLGGPPADPHTSSHAASMHPKLAGTASRPPRPAGRAALALQPPPGARLPAATQRLGTPSLYMTRADLPSTKGIKFLCCPFSIPMNRYFSHHHHHRRKTVRPLLSAPPSCTHTRAHTYTHNVFSFSQNPLSAWLCPAVLTSKKIAFTSSPALAKGKTLSQRKQKGLDFQNLYLGNVKSVRKSSGSKKT